MLKYSDVKLKIQTRIDDNNGLIVPYIEGYTVVKMLNESGKKWNDSYRLLEKDTKKVYEREEAYFVVECALSVDGESRANAGEGKDLKSAYTDAFKRAATKFGIGIELGNIPKIFAKIERKGKMYHIVDEENVKKKHLNFLMVRECLAVKQEIQNLMLWLCQSDQEKVKAMRDKILKQMASKAASVNDLSLQDKYVFLEHLKRL